MPLATVRGTDSSLPTARQNSPAPEAPQPRAQHPGVRPSWRGHPRKRKISSRLLLLASYASARDARQSRNSACSTRLLAPPDLSRFTMLMYMSLLHVISVSMPPRSHFPASRLEPPNIFCRWGERWARALLHFGTMHAKYLAFRNLVRVQVSCRTCSSNCSATYSRWDPTTRPVSTQASDAMIE